MLAYVSGKERFSIPFFFDPNMDCVVEPLATCVTDTAPALYKPTTYGEYLAFRYKITGETHEAAGE